MRIRKGFVSNSSSSSFVIAKYAVTREQIIKLVDYTGSEDNYDGWDITEGEWFIQGSTIMDNGTIWDFIKSLNLPGGCIHCAEG